MKKTYFAPKTEVLNIQNMEMIALSLQTSGKADATGEVLTKEDNAWDVWSDDEAGE